MTVWSADPPESERRFFGWLRSARRGAAPDPEPPSEVSPAPPAAPPQSAIVAPLPDVRLIDRSLGGDSCPVASRPALKPLSKRRTVMIVDDEPLMLNLLVRVLQRENYEILVADCAESALRQAEVWGRPIDLLVTDYAMPDISGRELVDALRVRQRDLPVLYQTGYSDMLFENRTELETRSSFLEKPFTPRGLLEAARFALFGALNPAV